MVSIEQFKNWLVDGLQSKPIAPQVSRYAAEFAAVFAERMSAPPRTAAERYAAMIEEALVERYAARGPKNSPGQLDLFGGNKLRGTKTQQRLNWDESKHPRDREGKFAEKGTGSAGAGKGQGDVKNPVGGVKIGDRHFHVKKEGSQWFFSPDPATAGWIAAGVPLAKLIGTHMGEGAEESKPEEKPAPEPEDKNPESAKPDTESTKAEDESAKPKAPKPSDLFGDDTPRDQAKKATDEDQSDYEFARPSAIPNAGEDLKGSARHKVNEWRSLEQAEKDGTAAKLVTRDQLLKNEPHELGAHAHRDPLTALAMHLALKAFPIAPGAGLRNYRPTPEEAKKDRSDYVEAYRKLKTVAEEELAKAGEDPERSLQKFNGAVRAEIERLRQSDRYNSTANALVKLYNQSRMRYRKAGIAGQVQDFKNLESQHHADMSPEDREDAKLSKVMAVLEGKSINAAFGQKGKAKGGFDAAGMYVAHASREGGPESPAKAAKAANDFLVSKAGFRGVQYGNSVSDKEREHHATMAAAAMVDLADITGLPVEAIGLNGKLGLAIGARGRANALAHYEPGTKVINLTRKRGVGSLAHEWAHALDHEMAGGEEPMMSSRGGTDVSYHSEDQGVTHTGRMVDGKWVSSKEDRRGEPLWKAMDGLRQAMRDSGFAGRLPDAMKAAGIGHAKARYWTSGREMFARCFERFAQRKLEKSGRKNTYLAGIETKAYKSGGLWPTDEEVDKMTPHFESLLDAHRQAAHGLEKPVRYSADERQAYIDRLTATLMGMTPEQYAARRLKDSPGQQHLFDEAKHPRANDGKFAGQQGGGKSRQVAATGGKPGIAPTGRQAALQKLATAGDERAGKQIEKDAPLEFKDYDEVKVLGDEYRGVKVYKRRNDDPRGRFRIDDPEYGERFADSINDVKKWVNASDQERSERAYAENYERVTADPRKASVKDLRRAMGFMDALHRHYTRQLDRGEITRQSHDNLKESLQSEHNWYKRLVKEKEEGGGTDRFASAFAGAVIERYRVGAGQPPPSKPKASQEPKTVVGRFGDRGRFVTTEDGVVIFIANDGTINRGPKELRGKKVDPRTAKGRERRPKTERSDTFTPKSELDHLLVEAVGDHPDDVAALRDYVADAYKMLRRESHETRDAMRQLLGHFGINGRQASGWLSSVKRMRDYDKIPRFDEMAEYAQKYYPELLAARTGESDKSGDAEASLFARLREGFPAPPAKNSPEVIDLAMEMAGPAFRDDSEPETVAKTVGKAVLEDPDDPFSDFVPFSVQREDVFRDFYSALTALIA